jgi:hypothetical protein
MIYNPHQIDYYYSGDQIKKNVTGEACSAYEQKMGLYRTFVWKNEEKIKHG